MVVIPSARYIALGRSCGGSRRSPAAKVITLKPRKAKKVSATLATIFEKDAWSLTASLPRSISTHERSWSWFALRPTMFRVARRRLRAGVPRRSRQERNYVATESRESVKTADLLRGFTIQRGAHGSYAAGPVTEPGVRSTEISRPGSRLPQLRDRIRMV